MAICTHILLKYGPGSLQAKGVAYRGRILLKVEMILGSSPSVPREILGTPDKEKSMVSLHRGHVCLPWNGQWHSMGVCMHSIPL